MGQNFDDYPGFQQIPGMPILLQQSVPVPKDLDLQSEKTFTRFYQAGFIPTNS